jgi:2-amino-4-hydroxy-6-hydroxymethyldihydropteridine diphosphokinase
MAVRAYVGIGANLGDPAAQVRRAIDALGALPGTRLAAASSLYRTAPVGYADQPDFVNAVAALDTELSPRGLLDGLLAIERDAGRERSFRNAPRTLDLDLLLYGDATLEDDVLTVPHPRMHERAFVLAPLAEIAPDAEIPGRGSAAACAARLPDQGVRRAAP